MLFNCRSGTVKTSFGCTYPKPALMNHVREKGTDSVSNVEGLDVIQVDTWAEFEEVYWYLKQEKKYKSVIIDQVSQLQDVCVESVMKAEGKDVMSQRTWGTASGLMKTWLLNYRDLIEDGINVLFLAHDRTTDADADQGDQMDPNVGPRLMPSVAATLNGAVKAIGCTYIREVLLDGEVRRVEYGMRLGPHAFYTTKLRMPVGATVPESIFDPSYDRIMKLMSGEQPKTLKKVTTNEKAN